MFFSRNAENTSDLLVLDLLLTTILEWSKARFQNLVPRETYLQYVSPYVSLIIEWIFISNPKAAFKITDSEKIWAYDNLFAIVKRITVLKYPQH